MVPIAFVLFALIGLAAVWVAIFLTALLRRPDWRLLPAAASTQME